ncbi:uncharacterized protein BdWA1_003688 [Babesia duncani]|nr:hypothetical protein BdWA1_003688 [Babesia duncani]
MLSETSTDQLFNEIEHANGPPPHIDESQGRIHFDTLGDVNANSCSFSVEFEANGNLSSTQNGNILDESSNTVIWNHEFNETLYDMWSDLKLVVSAELDFNKYIMRNHAEGSPRNRVKYGNKRVSAARYPGIIIPGPNLEQDGYESPSSITSSLTKKTDQTETTATSVPYKKAKYKRSIGRVVISLPLLFDSFGASKIERHGMISHLVGFCGFLNKYKCADSFQDFATHETNCTMWLQVMPFNQHKFDSTKFLRPQNGQPTFGMKNPKGSLGFLQVQINIRWLGNPKLLCIYSNLTPPSHHWITPPEFEMAHFSAMCDRLVNNVRQRPRWFDLFDPNFQKCNTLDIWFVGWFWLLLYMVIVHMPPRWIPLGIYIIVVTISIYYKHQDFRFKKYLLGVRPKLEKTTPQVSTQEASVISTPMGPCVMSLQRHPHIIPCAVFANDLGDVNIEETVKIGLFIMKILQVILGHTISLFEKIRFGISWVDPLSGIIALFIATSILVLVYFCGFILCLFSFQCWRWIAFLTFVMLYPGYNAAQYVIKLISQESFTESVGFNMRYQFKKLVKLAKATIQFYGNCYARIPDHREIDHRDICAMVTSHQVNE